jgi:hypothetical protein
MGVTVDHCLHMIEALHTPTPIPGTDEAARQTSSKA